MQACPAGREAGAVERLELVVVGVVDEPRDDFARVEGLAQVLGDESEEFPGVVAGWRGGFRGRVGLAVVEAGDDAAGEAEGVGLVEGEVVGESRGACVHVRAAE
ncbi:hypothetical protein GA0115246_105836 [Streptomyces sp. SolWspMP-sol7th]|nr:hypothetical protein GA0115246_105836 [Streptomyces sp. SolWspMP-sol7th]